MEEPVSGGAQRPKHAGGSDLQLGEIQQHSGQSAGLAGGRREDAQPVRERQTGVFLSKFATFR